METQKMMPTKHSAVVAHLLDAPLRVNALRYQSNLYVAEKCI